MEAYLGALWRVALPHGMEDREPLPILNCLGAQLWQCSKGGVTLHTGDPTIHLRAVLTDQVRMSRTKVDGQQMVMGEIYPGGLFAESFTCAQAENLSMTAMTAADATVLLIGCDRVSVPCSTAYTFRTRLVFNLLRILAEKNLPLVGKLGYLSGYAARRRLLSYLKERATRTGRATATVPFNRQVPANYLRVDHSALFHIIDAFQRGGVLTVRRDRFTLSF